MPQTCLHWNFFYPNFNHNYNVFISLPCLQSKPFPDLIGFHLQQWLGDLHTFVGGFPFTFHPPHCPMTHHESLVDFFDFPALMLNDTPAVLFIPTMLAMSSATQYELIAWPHPSSIIATSPGHHPFLAPPVCVHQWLRGSFSVISWSFSVFRPSFKS